MKPDELQEHIASTYFTLRTGIVVASVLLPVTLLVVGAFRPLQPDALRFLPSISDYYPNGTNFTRNWLVGTLCAVGTFLYLYKGYSNVENVVLNIAGVLAVIVALVPCRCGDVSKKPSIHGAAAVAFFVCIAFVAIRCSRDTLSLMPDEALRKRYQRRYHFIALAMVFFPVAAAGISFVFGLVSQLQFVAEAFGIYTFALYWLFKSRELSITQAERLVMKGKAEKVRGHGLVRVDGGASPPPTSR